ncbi:VanZ family protein [Noviherbaspirillum sp.]|uniref:VanZ family protein n=1 Tax=Noviherbaspirillum sp. TaxID=1926288 RepID=UPI002B46E5D3|nr:VanZ family protein [Noviherbaspirillum sp.]HJV80889.1 VanZ family protein [Noviherbaspirillum sp.]
MGWELILFLCGALAISAGCLVPARWLPPLPNDKLLHFLAFGGMALLVERMAQSGLEQTTWLIGLFVAGWLIECLQSWVPDRNFCWRDLAANTAGILSAAIFFQVAIRI